MVECVAPDVRRQVSEVAEATAKADEQEKHAQDARDSYADIRVRLVELAKAMGEVK